MIGRMKISMLCLLAVFGVAASARDIPQTTEEKKSSPWFCHDLDCPEFKVLNTTDKYEVRQYKAGKWVETKVEAILFSVGVTDGFKRLFNYISGKNEGNKKIEMTAPVVTNVVAGEGPFCKSVFTTFFFLPYAYQENPPKPSESDVHIYQAPPKETFAVLQFGGFLVDDYTLNAKAKLLQEALEKDDVKYDNKSFFSVGYDPPYRLQHRHNEIWIQLKEESNTDVILA